MGCGGRGKALFQKGFPLPPQIFPLYVPLLLHGGFQDEAAGVDLLAGHAVFDKEGHIVVEAFDIVFIESFIVVGPGVELFGVGDGDILFFGSEGDGFVVVGMIQS